jgi:sec-independent protein translocase protein TatA
MGIFDWKHWIVILIVVVLVFGTKKLKGLGGDFGETIKGFRQAMSDEEKPSDAAAAPPRPTEPQAPHRFAVAGPVRQNRANGCGANPA